MEEKFHIQKGSVGVVSICNNNEGTGLDILTKDTRYRALLDVGDTVTISIHSTDSFSVTHQPTSREADCAPSNFTVAINERTTHIPFAEGEGSASVFVVTMHKGTTRIDVGTIVTIPKEIPTDYIREELLPEDKICVTIG